MGGLAAEGQAFGERHLVKVQSRVQMVLVHLQLVPHSVDVLFCCAHTHTDRHQVKETHTQSKSILQVTEF